MAYIYNLSDAWNDAGVTYTSIKMSVTDTASNAASLLMDLQVGGVSKFSVSKTGAFTRSFSADAVVDAYGSANQWEYIHASLALRYKRAGAVVGAFTNGAFSLGSGASLAWSSGTPPDSANDLTLFRDAANTLAQRNGVNAQTSRIYNTYTDASNYERGSIGWVSNILRIGTDKAGTGAAREIQFLTDGTTRMTIATTGAATFTGNVTTNGGYTLAAAGYITWPSRASLDAATTNILRLSGNGTGAAMQLGEMTAPAAPATDSVYIYAEDNGSGKTRLMARFATGAAVQIAIEP